MVLQRRLNYGFDGYQVPAIPRSSRSARGRRLFKKKVEHNHMSAFELLATVAGNLLQESESCHADGNASAGGPQPAILKDTTHQEQQNKEKLLKVEHCNPGRCDESVFGSQGFSQNALLDAHLELTSMVANSDSSAKVGYAGFVIEKNRNEFRKFPGRVENGSLGYGDSCKGKIVDEIERQFESERQKISSTVNGTVPDTCSSEYPMELDTKPPALVSSDSSVELPMCRDHIPCKFFPGFQDDLNITSKDDDENSSRCTKPSTIAIKASRPPSRIGDRRIRKLLASKYWKVAPTLKSEELSNTDVRPVFRNRKYCFTRQRSQRISPLKRRKLFEHSSRSTSEGGISREAISNFPNRCINGNSTCSGRRSSSVGGQESSSQSRDSHVKLSIKSLRVPELFIEIAESATVGSLKRTVMEAVNGILGGGLHVGVILQGKKVRDDNKSLLQTGISRDDKLDTLNFTLEPNTTPAPQPLCHVDSPCLVPCHKSQPLARYLTTPDSDPGASDTSPYPPVNNVGGFIESDHDSVPSPDIAADRTTPDSRALVAFPENMKALAVVPYHRKSKRSELVQRRIRRPFSVSEVEALVQAVEKLGTGRWRDVKLRAFDNAKHRTYVDLKY